MFKYEFRNRRSHDRSICMSNVRQIGQAIQMYANENQGRFPDNLEQLLLTQDITPEVFTCPGTDIDRADGKTPQEQARHLHDHCSYVYHGKGLTTAAPAGAATRPVLCEPLMNHKVDGMNVLYADGHAEFLNPVEAQKLLQTLGN
jgi:prepilin-type processing-associated H-X9-DG protein